MDHKNGIKYPNIYFGGKILFLLPIEWNDGCKSKN